jgi:MFS family permease
MTVAAAAPQSVLRHPPFVLYWVARTCASLGYMMMGVAVAWQMYELTGSAFDLGLIALMQFLPMAAFMLIAGQVADRVNRRLLLQLCQIVEGSAAAALALAPVFGWVSKEFILAAVFIFGIGRAFDAPTVQTLLPSIVPSALFPRAVAASASTMQLATVCGPAVGGFLYTFGAAMPFAVAAALFLVSVVLLAFMTFEQTFGARAPISLSAFFAGVAYIWRNPIIIGTISLDLFAVLLGGTMALLPIFANEVFHTGPEGLGILRAAPAAGAVSVSAFLATWPLKNRIGRTMFVCVAIFGVATIVFALSTSFVLSLIALAVLGASDAVSVVIRFTLVQIETPDDMRGRVNAVNSLFTGTSNQLGDFRAGMMAAWLGAIPAVLAGGAGILLVVLIWLRAFPSIARVDSFYSRKV